MFKRNRFNKNDKIKKNFVVLNGLDNESFEASKTAKELYDMLRETVGKAGEEYHLPIERSVWDDKYWNDIFREITWSREHEHAVIYKEFCTQISKIETAMADEDDLIFHKMRLSYAVTLMESCLSEMLKSVTLSNDIFKRNAMNGITELKDSKVPIKSLFDKSPMDVIDACIIDFLSAILYHNIPKVISVYQVILGKKFPEPPAGLRPRIEKFMALRHDIAHRNGKTVKGVENEITPHIIYSAVENIALFVSFFNSFINDVLDSQD